MHRPVYLFTIFRNKTTDGSNSSVIDARTLVQNGVENPDTFSTERHLTEQNSSVFDHLPWSRLEISFGSHSARLLRAAGDQLLEECRTMIIETGVQRSTAKASKWPRAWSQIARRDFPWPTEHFQKSRARSETLWSSSRSFAVQLRRGDRMAPQPSRQGALPATDPMDPVIRPQEEW